MSGKRSAFTLLATLFVVTAAAYALARFTAGRVRSAKPRITTAATITRSELALIYIGNSRCGWCNDPELPANFATIRRFAGRAAQSRNQVLVVMGIAADPSATDGFEHLRKFGEFDQLSAGGGWANELALSYLFNSVAGPAATPTILVVERLLVVPDSADESTDYYHLNKRELVRKSGVFEIRRWVRDSVPIPRILPRQPEAVHPS